MKLKNRPFPFWAVVRSRSKKYKSIKDIEIVRISGLNPRFSGEDFIYDAVIKMTIYRTSGVGYHTTQIFSHQYTYSKTTVAGFKEVSSLPAEGKKIFLKHLFELES